MGKTHRQNKRDHEGDGNDAAFYAKVKPTPPTPKPITGRFPGMLTNGLSARMARAMAEAGHIDNDEDYYGGDAPWGRKATMARGAARNAAFHERRLRSVK